MKTGITIYNNGIGIPAILWGRPEGKVIIAVHGDMSHKEDPVIRSLARHSATKGYSVLSFDLPEHGDRKGSAYGCNPANAVSDLRAVYSYIKSPDTEISLFGCSLGAYFSLLAFGGDDIGNALFLSPVVDMERVLEGMMANFGISPQRLEKERQIELPIGKALDWDYYDCVRSNPAAPEWGSSIEILHGSEDHLSSPAVIKRFCERSGAGLTVMEGAGHYFHTEEQLLFFEQWLDCKM